MRMLSEMTEVLVQLACTLVPLALLIFGIIKLFAWLTSSGQPQSERRLNGGAKYCPQCRRRLTEGVAGCQYCAWGQNTQESVVAATVSSSPFQAESVQPGPGSELDIASRQLQRLWHDGLISASAYEAVRDGLDVQRKRMLAATSPAQPSIPPLVPTTAPALTPAFDSLPPPLPVLTPPVETPTAAQTAPPPESLDPRERVRLAAERHQQRLAERAQAEQQQAAASVAAPPPPPSRPWSQLLSAFMEDKHIRWGELVGGLLIVGCSIALVLSFWSMIAQQPLLKFGVLNGVTAGLFGIGFFIVNRWKLPTTGQGILLIAAMLVPLDMLAIAAVTQGTGGVSAWGLAGEAISLLLFGGFVYLAGGVLLHRWRWPLVLGVMGPSLAGLAIARHVSAETPTELLYLLAAAPLACYLAAVCWLVAALRHKDKWRERDAVRLFKILGLASFSTLLPLGLLVARTGHPISAMSNLAPLFSLASGPSLVVGLMLWRRLTHRNMAGLRTAGTAVGLCGAMVLLVGVALAWPQPATLVPTAAVAAFILTGLALVSRMPTLHGPAAACAALGWLGLWHVIAGHVGWHVDGSRTMLQALFSASSGAALTPLAICIGLVAAVLGRRRPRDAQYLLASAGGVAAASLGLAAWFGFGVPHDPDHVAWIIALYAAGAGAAAVATRKGAIAWAASGLALAAIVQAVTFNLLVDGPWPRAWLTAFLVHASLATLAAVACGKFWRLEVRHEVALACRQSAIITTVVALAISPWFVLSHTEGMAAGHSFWLAAIWLVLALLAADALLFAAFQAAVSAGMAFLVAAGLARQAWFVESAYPWLDPWTLAAVGIALGLLSLAFLAARLVLRRLSSAADEADSRFALQRMLANPWSVDRLLSGLALADFLFLAVYAGLPGVAQELSPRIAASAAEPRIVPEAASFAFAQMPHAHAQGPWTWLLLGVVVVLLLGWLWERFDKQMVQGLVLAGAAACPLLAARWEGEVSTASALRWLTVGFLALGSMPIWFRRPLARWCRRLDWPDFARQSAGLSTSIRWWVLLLSVVPLVGMALYTGAAALQRSGMPTATHDAWPWLGTLAVMALLAAGGLRAAAVSKIGMPAWTRQVAALIFMLGLAPLLALSLFAVSVALKLSPILGPDLDAFFGRVGLAISYAVPVLATALVLVGHALRERSSGFALSAGLVFNVGGTAAWLLALAKGGLSFDAVQWVRLAQLNAIIAAAYGGTWLAVAWWRHAALSRLRDTEVRPVPIDGLLVTQIMLAAALNGVILIWAGMWVFADPQPHAFLSHVASGWGWLAFGLALAVFAASAVLRRQRLPVGMLASTLLGLGVICACALSAAKVDEWLTYHAWLAGMVATGWLLLGLGWLARVRPAALEGAAPIQRGLCGFAFDRRAVTRWTAIAGTLGMLLSLREPFLFRISTAWWSALSLAALAGLAAALACWSYGRRYIYVAGGLAWMAANAWWLRDGYRYFTTGSFNPFINWLHWNIIALALPAAVWAVLELKVLRPALEGVRPRLFPFHRLAAGLSLVLLSLLTALCLAADAWRSPSHVNVLLAWLAVGSVFAAIAACWWDVQARLSVASMYLLGLAAIGIAVDGFDLPLSRMHWTGTMIVAAYTIGTSYLWSRREGLRVWGRALQMPVADGAALDGQGWLAPVNCLMAGLVLASALTLDLSLPDIQLRLLSGKAALWQIFSVGMLARGRRESELRSVALLLGAAGAVAWGWAWLDPATTGTVLNRAVVVALALAATTIFYGLGLAKLLPRLTEWSAAARKLTPALVVAAGVALGFVLAAECWYAAMGKAVPIAAPAIAAVAVAMLGLCGAALVAAVVPGRDPLGLSERGRMLYVYAAEALLALVFLHVRLTMPWLFHGFFSRYWPMIALGVALASAGLAELFRRQRRTVLAEPLERTGAFLPLVPMLGFWAARSRVDYPLLLLSVGALYAGMSCTRRSFVYGLAAGVATNAALWFHFQRLDGFGLFDHPQLWLIPPALSALAAAHMNRRRLSEQQHAAVRSSAAALIYASSTADIFINGVAHQPWLPVVLAGLSIAGILAGIGLRVRTFLFLGTSFLLVALAAIIWHAAVDLHQTWLVWVAGIVAGLLIIALFGTFERKRNEVLGLVDQIKQWRV
ncbi:MAG: hypothetical protein AB7I37_01410 [Pirellulales bacterium]